MTPEAQRRQGVHQLLVSDGLLEQMLLQANPGKSVTVEWGEPDEHGNYNPVMTVHQPPFAPFVDFRHKEPVPA